MDAAAVRYLLQADGLAQGEVTPLPEDEVLRKDYYARPQPEIFAYDGLLGAGGNESAEVAQ